MEGAVALVLALLAIPFVLPLISWVMARRVRRRVDELEERIVQQDERITRLTNQLTQLKKEGVAPQPPAARRTAVAALPASTRRRCVRVAAGAPPPPVTVRPPVDRDAAGHAGASAADTDRAGDRRRQPRRRASMRRVLRNCVATGPPPPSAARAAVRAARAAAAVTIVRLGTARRRAVVLGDRRHRAGVRGGVLPALLDRSGLAAAAGARDHRHRRRDHAAGRVRSQGRAQVSGHRECDGCRRDRDPVLDVLRRAFTVEPDLRRRRVRTARARDAGRGAAVDRRDSLFIAVLGLLGGFATPILLSTGENRPIPLFGYLLLLNVGLAWVAYRNGWIILSTLTLVLTTLYQWGWVARYLDAAQVPLAIGIFTIFPLIGYGVLMVARSRPGHEREDARRSRSSGRCWRRRCCRWCSRCIWRCSRDSASTTR